MSFSRSDCIFIFSDYSSSWKRFVAYQHGEEDYWPWNFILHILLNCIELHRIILVSSHFKEKAES